MDSMGLQGTHSGVVALDDARIPDSERVGTPGAIGSIINFDMQSGLHSGIVATGIALGTFGRLLDIVKANNSFEKYESVRVRVSQLASNLSVMRTHAYALAQMASLPDSTRPPVEAATMTAKLFLSENALQMTTDAIAIAGKAGYLRENGLERLHRGRFRHCHRRPHQRSSAWLHRRNRCAAPTDPRIYTRCRNMPSAPKIMGVIPARFNSTRLPGKALREIAGRPMIHWVYLNARLSPLLTDLAVATDSPEIQASCEAAGIPVFLTREHPSGTDRVHEVLTRTDADIYVNIQGDEPTLRPDHLGSDAGTVRKWQRGAGDDAESRDFRRRSRRSEQCQSGDGAQ